MYDCIIVGGGPAGMAAAIYLARQQLHFAMFTGEIGGQIVYSSDVENYLGLPDLSGIELVQKFQAHLEHYQDQFELHENEKVSEITRLEKGFGVKTATGVYKTKTILITTGSKHRKLNIPGEKELERKGVTYCATCDAPLFRDKDVAIVGGGNSAMDAALFAEKYSSKIHLININEQLMGDDVMKAKVTASEKILIHNQHKTLRIEGKDHVEAIVITSEGGKEERLPVEGVFIEIGLVPVADFIDFVKKDRRKQIVIDKLNLTNVEGVYAAGDVTDVSEKQIAVSVGEGSKAALSIIKYLGSKADG